MPIGNIGNVGNIFNIPELKKRILFSLLMLAVYRIGCTIPIPGIDVEALSSFFARYKHTLLEVFDMFSGGAVERMSIFALGIMPYITASIILDLLSTTIPYLKQLKKAGNKKITYYVRYCAIIFSFVQGIGIMIGLENAVSPNGNLIVPFPGWMFRFVGVITLASGTAFIMWIGEKIAENGIGNGISLIIFSGIVTRMPSAIYSTVSMALLGEIGFIKIIIVLFIMIFVIASVCFVEQGQRRITIQYAKRVIGRRIYSGQSSHLPLKINTAGVIPPIFASSLIMFPITVGQFIQIDYIQRFVSYLTPGKLPYNLIYIALIYFLSYFYTAITFNPTEIADNIKKNGGFIPGIRPGKHTAHYIDQILTRLIFSGATYVSMICILPTILVSQFNVPFYFGGTALLIIVGVSIDTMTQIESYLFSNHYDSFVKKGMIKGRIK